jgi:hypothetical protein
MLKFSLILLTVLLTGCNTSIRWSKQGVTQQVANQEHYQCLKESQQQQSSAYVNGYGGAANSSLGTNQDLYNACMSAHGYSWEKIRTQGLY